jgi:hypothetical protein
MIVCGAPFFFDAPQSFVGFEENLSRKAGRLSVVRSLSHDVVSVMHVAAPRLAFAFPHSR